ncbi:hypothetical protein DL764_007435 [Monosporascus ibericus]|uniref:BAH domain-containing protein n=1 Tax=Monosporascus ibericus TaxID=155417 RepID=A0A4V1X9M2_9PEZI|nr:hypothetical protein DL764_007435 [Monosporascus ibericus]
MATACKRPRPEKEETRAECPFTLTYPDLNETKKKEAKKKKARRGRQESEQEIHQSEIQPSPFSPLGEFQHPNATLDCHYQVQPFQEWINMKEYGSFKYKGVKYSREGFVFVNNEGFQLSKKSDKDLVARILEIRASDEHHIYARVCWMYSPDEVPSGEGRQSYHGQQELIASNHTSATVNHWDENEDEIHPALYWRQAFDVRHMELSGAKPRCRCKHPENPDKTMICCTNEECQEWLHDDCLIHEALLNTYTRLGTDKSHKSAPIKEEQEEGPKRLLSPSKSGTAQNAKHSIDVDPEPSGPSTARPYEGFFEGAMRSDDGRPLIQIRDLRKNATNEEKEWTELISCLVCGHQID